MKHKAIRTWLGGVCLALGLCCVCGTASHGAQEATEPGVEFVDVAGRVVDDATGAPVAGATVSLLYETVVTDAEGKFLFQRVPTVHTSVISLQVANNDGVVIGCTSFEIPVRFYPIASADGSSVDVRVIEPGADDEVVLRRKAVGLDQVAAYCEACHTNNPCAETSSFNKVVEEGKELRGIMVKESELAAYKEKLLKEGLIRSSYVKLRHQDTHPDGMDMNAVVSGEGPEAALFQVPTGLTMHVVVDKDKVEHRYVICDTCHSRHVPTSQRQFVLKEFEEESTLCYQCHR